MSYLGMLCWPVCRCSNATFKIIRLNTFTLQTNQTDFPPVRFTVRPTYTPLIAETSMSGLGSGSFEFVSQASRLEVWTSSTFILFVFSLFYYYSLLSFFVYTMNQQKCYSKLHNRMSKNCIKEIQLKERISIGQFKVKSLSKYCSNYFNRVLIARTSV